MKFTDFSYDGQYLSDFGFIACVFEASSGITTQSAGAKISFTKVSRDRGRIYGLVNTEYSECLTATFDICKNPDVFTDPADMKITQYEFRDIFRWLNRRSFHQLRIIPDECVDEETITCFYNASFNIEKIKLAEDLVGLRLTLETDAPFGYGEDIVKNLTYTASKTTNTVNDMSDEVGSFYPDMTITARASGNLTMTNTELGISMVINNITVNEVITILGKEQIILSSKSTHDIANDFNYEFMKIGNSYSNRQNHITCNLPCTVKISYKPVIKETP